MEAATGRKTERVVKRIQKESKKQIRNVDSAAERIARCGSMQRSERSLRRHQASVQVSVRRALER